MTLNLAPPPRRTGNVETDVAAQTQWLQSVYNTLQLENELVTQAEQLLAGDFDPTSLPDPASATIATAQQTANQAYAIGATALALIQEQDNGTVTVSGTDTTGAVVFTEAQADADYRLALTPTAETGSPLAAARDITTIAKTATGFTVTVDTAPGAGTSVTFDFLLMR